MQKLQEFIKDLADKLNLPIFVVEDIIDHQFEFLKTSMQKEDIPDVYLKNLGRFRVKKGRLDWLIKNLEKKDSNEDQVEKLKKIRNEKFGRS